jgi:pentatricopeptide repeat protein
LSAFVDINDVRVYNMLLSACARAGDARAGFAAFVMMYDAGVKPDCRAYTTLISACAKAGDVEKAFETFRRMEMDQVEPSVVTYGALMDALSRRVLELTNRGSGKGRGHDTRGEPRDSSRVPPLASLPTDAESERLVS